MTITIQGLPQGISLATAWQVAVAKDWQSTTSPMCRTTDGITCMVSDDTAVFSFAVNTATERFLRVVDGKGEGVLCSMQIVGISDGTPCCFVTMPWVCRPALDPHGSAGPLPPIPTTPLTSAQIEAMIATDIDEDVPPMIAQAIAEAEAVGTKPYTTLSGASGTVEPGKVYTLAMTRDFTLNASAETEYGESVLFVAPGAYAFSVASGITLDADMSSGNRYRLLVSWTPYGVHVEQTAEWEVA